MDEYEIDGEYGPYTVQLSDAEAKRLGLKPRGKQAVIAAAKTKQTVPANKARAADGKD